MHVESFACKAQLGHYCQKPSDKLPDGSLIPSVFICLSNKGRQSLNSSSCWTQAS